MSDSEGDSQDPSQSEHRELIYRQFQATKECMELTGKAMSDGPLESLYYAAERCKEALDTGDFQTLAASVDASRAVASHLPSSVASNVGAATAGSAGRPQGPEPIRRHSLNTWRPSWQSSHDGPKPKASGVSQQLQEANKEDPRGCHGEVPSSLPSELREQKDLADAAAKAGNHGHALRMYEEMLEHCPDVGRVAILCNAALMALKVAPLQGRWPWVKHMLHLALKYSNDALKMDPDNVKAHYRRGCALEALERFRDAYFAYSAAISLDPEDARVRAAFDRIGRYGPNELGVELKAQIEATRPRGKSRARAKGIQPNGTKKETQKTSPPPHDPSRTCSECCLCKGDVVGGDFFAVPCGHGPFCGCCRRHLEEDGRGLRICQLCRQSDASSEQMLISDWVLAEALQGQCPRQDNKNKTSGRFRHPFGPRRPPEMVREAEERLQTLPPRWEEEESTETEATSFLQRMD